MNIADRSLSIWSLIAGMIFLTVMILLGQSSAVFNYDFAVSLSLQESADKVGSHFVQFNRAVGAADTVAYIPLLVASIIGLLLRQRWALYTTAAVMGISLYWPVICLFMMLFMSGESGYNFPLSPSYVAIFVAVMAFGAWGLYVCIQHSGIGETIIDRSKNGE